MRCGSCSPVVAVKTLTLSPPSVSASAPHSGTVANTFRSACARDEKIATEKAAASLTIEAETFIKPPERQCEQVAGRGAPRAATETYQVDRRGSEHGATKS